MKMSKINVSLISLFVLNIFDLYMTLYGINNNYVEEANPLMKVFYDINPILFTIVKLLVVVLVIGFIYFVQNKSRIIQPCLIFANIFYLFIFYLHIKYYYMFLNIN